MYSSPVSVTHTDRLGSLMTSQYGQQVSLFDFCNSGLQSSTGQLVRSQTLVLPRQVHLVHLSGLNETPDIMTRSIAMHMFGTTNDVRDSLHFGQQSPFRFD